MNTDTVVHVLQRSFRVTLGATASLVEILQDPQKREANLTKIKVELDQLTHELREHGVEIFQDPQKREANLTRIRTELDQLTREWAEKGEVTEQEARSYVDTFIAQRRGEMNSGTTVTTTATPVPTVSPEVQLELQELTAQLAALRAEVERLRTEENQS